MNHAPTADATPSITRNPIYNDKNCRVWKDLFRFVGFIRLPAHQLVSAKPTEGVSCGQKSYKSEQIEQIIPRLTPCEQGIPHKDHAHEKA